MSPGSSAKSIRPFLRVSWSQTQQSSLRHASTQLCTCSWTCLVDELHRWHGMLLIDCWRYSTSQYQSVSQEMQCLESLQTHFLSFEPGSTNRKGTRLGTFSHPSVNFSLWSEVHWTFEWSIELVVWFSVSIVRTALRETQRMPFPVYREGQSYQVKFHGVDIKWHEVHIKLRVQGTRISYELEASRPAHQHIQSCYTADRSLI